MENKIYSKVFTWLFLGLLVTFLTGIYTSNNIDALSVIFVKGGYWVLVILEVVVAIYLSVRIHKMSPTAAKICYLLYTFLTGLTFSSLFIVYKLTSLLAVFGITSVLFLIFAAIGRYTKIDLSRLGIYLFMMLLGVIILSIVSIFVPALNLGVAILGIVVFLGYIAFDIQMIKRREGMLEEDNLAVYCAFQLYIDFINVFVDLLRIFGDAND